MSDTKPGKRKLPPRIELTAEFRYTNYRETIERMLKNGICKKGTAQAMLGRVEKLVGEGSE